MRVTGSGAAAVGRAPTIVGSAVSARAGLTSGLSFPTMEIQSCGEYPSPSIVTRVSAR